MGILRRTYSPSQTPFRRGWWTHSHIQLTLRVSIADPQTATRQQNVTRYSRSVASLAPLS
ncbi:hypothetical protein B6R25_18580 [Escherichia coli]|nr:hypothetical protein [Escherichia coli]